MVVLTLVAAFSVAFAVAFLGARAYAAHRGDADLAAAILGNLNACKTAPAGRWHRASDFPAHAGER